MSVTVVLGAQWGDEGKGKLVDILSADFDVCARCAGGNNAGHTIVVPVGPEKVKTTFAFHLLPSGLVNPTCVGLIGSGVVVHVPSFFNELDALQEQGLDCSNRIFISDRAHLVFDFHQIVDGLKEVELGGSSIGTTKKGIGPAYSGKASRSGLRVHHLFDHDTFAEKFRKIVEGRFKRYGHFEYDTEGEIERYKVLAQRLKPFVVDSVAYTHGALAGNKKVLVEGANALMLDLDFGTYPYVTSSSTTIGGVCTGLGIPPKAIGHTIGVIKAYTTRVGGGPFPTEQLNPVGVHLQEIGREYGTTTGRRRRCGWLDLVVMKHSCLINGYDSLNLTKLDVLDELEDIKVAVKYTIDDKDLEYFPADLDVLGKVSVVYVTLPGWKTHISSITSFDELPDNCKKYVGFIENFLNTAIEWIGIGRDWSIFSNRFVASLVTLCHDGGHPTLYKPVTIKGSVTMNTMDPGAHHTSQSTLTPVSSSRRRSRENETPQQRQKREKAAERQRRKRERDRTVNNINAMMAFTQPTDTQPLPQTQPSQPPTQTFTGQEMTPEEVSRRERVRAAARERQRKHRSLVKQRKMRELGMDMPNEMIQGLEEYRVNGDGQYQQVLPHEMAHQPHAMNPQDASFSQAPPPQLTGGQNFASTLLLSFSCAPLLKQHLLRTLAITSDELASLEPVIADAFDQWDHQRRMHYAQQAAAKGADVNMGGPSAGPFPNVDMTDPSGNGFGGPSQPDPSEFRARFHRSLVAPSPFRNFNPDASTTATTSTPTSTTTSGPPSDPIDPHLTGVVVPVDTRQKSVTLETDFGQAKGEAEGVAGRLER